MKRQLLYALLMVATSAVAGEALPDLRVPRVVGGLQELHEVRLMRIEPDGMRVMHSTGTAKVPFEFLPSEVRTKYAQRIAEAEKSRDATATSPAPGNGAVPPSADSSPAPAPGGGVRLKSMEDIKAVWLAQCDPRTLNPLDRDLVKKRAALAQRALNIRAGQFNFLATAAAHSANAQALRAAGDLAGAAREEAAGGSAYGQMATDAKREEVTRNVQAMENASIARDKEKAAKEQRLLDARQGFTK